MSSTGQHVSIALIVSWNLAYCRAILRGVRRFALDKPDWVLMPIDPHAATDLVAVVRLLKASGVIAHIYEPKQADILRRLDMPVVNVGGIIPDARLPRAGIDDLAVGEMAAAHLMDRGLRQFAFAGHASHGYSVKRCEGFSAALARREFTVHTYAHHLHHSDPFVTQGGAWAMDEHVQRWLAELPKPVGLLACNDLWGMQLTEACRQVGLRIPEDVAIVGVDDDDLLCGLARPSMSSVKVPAEPIGFLAASMLDDVMSGRPLEKDVNLIPPVGVAARQSSDLVATADAEVAAAVRFIRARVRDNICVEDVLDMAGVGRRSLERRFRAVIGRGIWEEIRRSRLAVARELLAESILPMPDVAAAAGFASAKQLSLVFRQELDMTPSDYRHKMAAEKDA